jgi:hypothetical protein
MEQGRGILMTRRRRYLKPIQRELRFWVVFVRNRTATIKWPILLLFVIACFYTLHNDLHIFENTASHSETLDRLALSFVAAFIFYFVNIQLETERHRVKMSAYLHNKIGRVVHLRRVLFAAIKTSAGICNHEDHLYLVRSELQECLAKIPPVGPVVRFDLPINQEFENWYEALLWIHQENDKIIHELLLIKDYLRSDVIRILLGIEDRMEILERMVENQRKNPADSMQGFSSILYEYKVLSEELAIRFHNQYKYYREEYHHIYVKSRLRSGRPLGSFLGSREFLKWFRK